MTLVLEISGGKCYGNCVQVCSPDLLRLDTWAGDAVIARGHGRQICHPCRLSRPVDATSRAAEHSVPPLVFGA
jgi:hypothetical protein